MKRLLYPALIGLALAGCAQAEKQDRAAAETPNVETPATAQESQPALLPAVSASTPVGLTAHPATRSVIYHGEMSLRVEDFEQVTDRLDALLSRHGAVLGTAHETRANGQHQQDLTIKVRPEQFLPLVSAIGKLGRIEQKDISSSDVTADILAARDSAAAKQRLAGRLQQAGTTAKPEPDTRTRQLLTEADAARNLARSLGLQSQWATLTLHFYQPLAEEETTEPLPAYGPRFAAAFVRGGSILLNVLVGLTHLWPLGLLGGLGYWAMRRWQRQHAQS